MLNVRGVRVSYGRVNIIEHLDLQVEEGEIVSLVGPNGAGKSTLFRAISGLLPVERGRVWAANQDITGWAPHRIVRLGIGQVPEGRQIFTQLSVRDNLALAVRYGNREKGKDLKTLYRHVFSLFPVLEERQHTKAGLLSGGQQQMLAIGKALMVKPRLLLLDEPSLGLAPLIVREMFRVILELQRSGITVFLIEQNALAALRISHRAYVMENGRIQFAGKASELLENPSIKEHYLGIGAPIRPVSLSEGHEVHGKNDILALDSNEMR